MKIIHKPSFVVDDATGATFWPTNAGAAFDAGNARFRVAGVDLSVYATADNRYKLVAKDSALLKAEGFIDVADSAEALDSELITDGAFANVSLAAAKVVSGITKNDPGVVTFAAAHGFVDGTVVYFTLLDGMTELNTEYWKLRSKAGDTFELSDTGIATWDASSLDTSGYGAAEVSGNGRAQAVDFTSWTEGTGWYPGVDGAGALTGKADCDGTQAASKRIGQDILTDLKHYKAVYTVTRVAGSTQVGFGGGLTGSVSGSETYTRYGVDVTNTEIRIWGDTSFIGSIDNVSCKEVTNVGADGVLIMSTKGGATQSWALQESGIDLNDIATFEVQRATRHHG